MQQLLFIIQRFLCYKINAKGSFSIHSPFVFQLFNNVIKRKNYRKGYKKHEIIYNIYSYCKDFDIYILSDNMSLTDVFTTIHHPYTLIIIDNLDINKHTFKLWDNFLKHNTKYISIDFYHIGLIINNPNILSKQNYILIT